MKPRTKHFTVLLLLCLFFYGTLYAKKNPGVVTGKIVEHQTEQPVAYANVALLERQNEKVVAGIISRENGNFTIEQVPYGNYQLQISYLGYKQKTLQVSLKAENNPYKVGKISLKPEAEQLNEVIVAEKRLKGKQEVDRTVYTVNSKVQKISTDGIDVLKHIPGVSVDFQDNVTLEGTGNILYQVNGITRDKQFVAQLHPDDINKVEVVTNPGVEYDADIDAVINIVLKKHQTGGRGSVNIEGADPGKMSVSERIKLEYGGEKFRIFASDRLHYENFHGYQTIETRITNDGDVTTLNQDGEGTNQWINNSVNYGVDLFLNDQNTINLYGSYYVHTNNMLDFEQNGIRRLNEQITDRYNMNMDQESIGRGLYHSLFYKRDFEEKGHKLTSQVNYYDYESEDDNTYNYVYALLDGENLTDPYEMTRFDKVDNQRNMVEWKNDYARMLGNVKMKTGYWSYYQWYDNRYSGDHNTERDFNYNELRQEIYANGSGKLSALQWNAGVRMAYSRTRIDAKATNRYTEFLPQMSLKYGLSKASSLKMSLRRSIDRPGMSQLNPFEIQTDSLTIERGNPNLDPQLINSAELQYAVNFKSNYIAPKAYLEYTTNSGQQTSFVNEEGISIIQPDNVGERYEYGVSLTGAAGVFRWLRINANVRVYNTEVRGPDNYHDEATNWGINGSAIVSPWKDKDIHFMTLVRYQSPQYGYKSETSRDMLVMVGFDAAITDQLKASGYMFPFDKKFKYNAVERTNENYYYSQVGRVDAAYIFALKLSYSFKWGKEPKKLNRSTDYERDGSGGTL